MENMSSRPHKLKNAKQKSGVLKSCDCNSNISIANKQINLVIERLNSGQDIIPKTCPCSSEKSTRTVIGQNKITCPVSGESKNYFEEWQKTLTNDDEHANMFCMCRRDSDVVDYQSEMEKLCNDTNKVTNSNDELIDTSKDAVRTIGSFTDLSSDSKSNTQRTKSGQTSANSKRSKENKNKDIDRQRPAVERKRNKKKKKKKKKCPCERVVDSNEFLSFNVITTEKAIEIAQAIYPGVNCGHKECIREPVVTPKNMGWLWSLRETGGVKINRNWRPGAIPKNVISVMEKVREGEVLDKSRNSFSKAKKLFKNVSSVWSLDSKNRRNNGQTMIEEQKKMTKGEPILTMSKHNGQYGFKMNPMPSRNKDGELVYPKNIEPVNIKLGRRGDRNPVISSQSSMDIELVPQYGVVRPSS